MENTIKELNEVFELAKDSKEFIDDVLKKSKSIKKEKTSAQIGSSGHSAQIGSSGDYAKIGSSGYYAKIGSSGDSAQISNSGDSAKIGSSGCFAQISNSGRSVKIGSSGYFAKIGSSGHSAQIGSSGDHVKIGSSGYSAKIGSSGHSAQIGSSGDYAQIGNSGDYVRIGSSGHSAKIESTGEKSVISAIGENSIIKGKKGSWITLVEYKDNEVYHISSIKIDGKTIKEDTFYCLCNKEFKEVVEFDGIQSVLLSKKGNIYKVKNFGDNKSSFVIKIGDIYSHGRTIKEARDSLMYKIKDRDTSEYKDTTLDTILTKKEAIRMYRVITGACELGAKYFTENLNTTKRKISVKDLIELTKEQYGNDTLKGFFKDKNKG